MCCQPACSPCGCHCSGLELWVPASCQLVNCVRLCWKLCVCVYVRMLPWEHFVDSALQCQWHIEQGSVGVPWFSSCCVYFFCLLLQNTLKSITLLTLSFSTYFSLSVDLSYLLLTSLALSFQISSCVVVSWRASRQPVFISPSARGRIELLSHHPHSYFIVLFCLKS